MAAGIVATPFTRGVAEEVIRNANAESPRIQRIVGTTNYITASPSDNGCVVSVFKNGANLRVVMVTKPKDVTAALSDKDALGSALKEAGCEEGTPVMVVTQQNLAELQRK